jgi:hypothetical protein
MIPMLYLTFFAFPERIFIQLLSCLNSEKTGCSGMASGSHSAQAQQHRRILKG